MDSVPADPCDCWRLVYPLAPGEPLPDHLCQETMLETTRRAIADGLLPESELWPIRVGKASRAVGCVVRQWIEGGPSEVLAQQLIAEAAWQREVRSLLSTFRYGASSGPVVTFRIGSLARASPGAVSPNGCNARTCRITRPSSPTCAP